MNFTQTELKVLKYALDWCSEDTIDMDHDEHNEIYKTFFGKLKASTIKKTRNGLVQKLKDI